MKKLLFFFIALFILVGCAKNKPSTIQESIETFLKSKLNKEMVLDNVKIIKVDTVTQFKEIVNEISFLTVELAKQKQILELNNKILAIQDSLPFFKGKVWWEVDPRTKIVEYSKDKVNNSDSIVKGFSKRLDILKVKVADDSIAKNIANLQGKARDSKIIDNKKLLYYLVTTSFIIKPNTQYEYKFKVSKDFEILN